MKGYKSFFIGTIAAIFLLLSCTSLTFNSTVKKYYEQGEYIDALTAIIPLLKQDPHFDEGIELLPDVYRKALTQNNALIAILKKNGTAYDWDKVVYQYNMIHRLNDRIGDLPTLVHSKTKEEVNIRVQYFYTELEDAELQAAEAHYQVGISLKEKGGSISVYQNALKEFDIANGYVSNYKEYTRHVGEVKTLIADIHYNNGMGLKLDRNNPLSLGQAVLEMQSAMNYVPGYKDAKAQIVEIKVLLADYYYKSGLALKRAGASRNDLKKAITEFKTALRYTAGYKDVEKQIQETEELLMNRVIIMATRGNYVFDYYVNSESVIQNRVLADILNDPRTDKYTTLLSREQLDRALFEQELSVSDLSDQSTAVEIGAILGANLILAISVDSVIYTEPQMESSMEEVDKDFEIQVPVEIVDKNGTIQKGTKIEIETASALIYLYTKTSTAIMTCSYKLIDVATLEIIMADTITRKVKSEVEWATFSGDERAVPAKYLGLIRTSEKDTEEPRNMILQAAKFLADRIPEPIIKYLE